MRENKNEVSKFYKYLLFFIAGVFTMVFLMLFIYGPLNYEAFEKDKWVLVFCVLSVLLVYLHLFYVVFNYEAWKAKREYQIEKWKSKRLSKLISSNEFDKFITELSEEQRKILKSKL